MLNTELRFIKATHFICCTLEIGFELGPPREIEFDLDCLAGRLGTLGDEVGDLVDGVAQVLLQADGAAILLERAEAVRAEVLVDVNVRDSRHQRTQDDLGVVLKVYLEN